MSNRYFHIATLVLLTGLLASCERTPTEPADAPGTVQFRLEESGTPLPPALAAFLKRAGIEPVQSTENSITELAKSSASQAINEARVLVLDCTKWSSEFALLLALDKEPDSLYNPAVLDPRRDVWDNLLAIFKGYKGRTYHFAGEYVLSVQGGFARGVVSVRPGLNIFFAVLREGKQTVYVYSTLARIQPVQNAAISLSPSAVVKTLLNSIAVWDSSGWNPLGSGVNGEVNAVAANGNLLYAGGSFSRAGNIPASNIAVWNTLTSSWSGLGPGVNGPVSDIQVVGTDVYVTGAFTNAGAVVVNNVARWNGSTWSALGSGLNGQANAVTASGTSIYVGGNFSAASGSTANNIAEWNGAAWSALSSGTNGTVFALASTGSSVILGGNFGRVGPVIGGVQTGGIASWNGSWSGFSTGVNTLGSVRSLAVAGNLVFAGGFFSTAGAVSTNSIAVWDGVAWQGLGSGVNGSVRALTYDPVDSSLYVGGLFLGAGSASAANIARYKSGTWSTVGAGLDGPVNAFAVSGRRLFVGGAFKYNY